MKRPELSFVIPAKDEAKSLPTLHQEIVYIVKKVKKTYEIIFVDDGSTDDTFATLTKLRQKDKKIKIIRHRGNWGKSVALQNGFTAARGQIIITLDADLQDNPADLPKFLTKITAGYDLVSGWKKTRHDPLSKVIPSRVINFFARVLSGVKIHDMNCGFKAYRREVTQNLSLYGDLYRFIPILVARKNFKITEVIVRHRGRRFGQSKYDARRFVSGFLDLITIFFLVRYLRRPAHFFGTLGAASFLTGFAIGLYIAYLRFTTGGIGYRHPLLFLGILLMVIGVQLVTTGLLAEMITHMTHAKEDSQKAIQ